jgi:hypothetical protein
MQKTAKQGLRGVREHLVTRAAVTDTTGRVVHTVHVPAGTMVKLAGKLYVVGRHGEVIRMRT